MLVVFACLQFLNANALLALGELSASAVLLISSFQLKNTKKLRWWIHGYLIFAFCFLVYIIAKPQASTTAFVWIFIMPVLSYLLLGKIAGFLLATPFMLAGSVFFYLHLDAIDSARVMIDLLNPLFCAVLVLAFMHLYETRRAEAQDKLVSLAETDALTGLANRSTFQATLARTVNESLRNKTPFALVLMDIDHFKKVNDSFGHDAGDRVLHHISRRLTERLRNTDFVGRLGGEEFGLILRDVENGGAYPLIEALRQRIESSELAYGAETVKLTASFGIAYWPKDADKQNELYQAADRRLYSGKRAGRNIVSEHDDTSESGHKLDSETTMIG
nr:GGDEF domain-containing protein [Marinobacter caseinilyticus]